MEEKRYCIFCGSPLEEGSDICPSCKKQVPVKENLFKEYLYRNTKDKLKSKVDDTLFSLVKNWILSHLYGVVVSLVIVGLAINSLAAPSVPSYIEKINSSSRPGVQEDVKPQQQSQQASEDRITRDDKNEAVSMTNDFLHAAFYEKLVSETGGMGLENFKKPEKPSADYFLPSSYGGVTQNDYYVSFGYKETRSMLYHDDIIWDDPKTETGKKLHAEGYPVAEAPVSNLYKDEHADDAPVVREEKFLFVLVKADGQWYIAEVQELD